MMLHHHAQPFRGTRDAGVEPSRAAVLERKALVEQYHVVPLRALRFMHREHIAVIELVIGLALLPRDGLDGAAKTVAADRAFCPLGPKTLVGRQPNGDDLGFRPRARFPPP